MFDVRSCLRDAAMTRLRFDPDPRMTADAFLALVAPLRIGLFAPPHLTALARLGLLRPHWSATGHYASWQVLEAAELMLAGSGTWIEDASGPGSGAATAGPRLLTRPGTSEANSLRNHAAALDAVVRAQAAERRLWQRLVLPLPGDARPEAERVEAYRCDRRAALRDAREAHSVGPDHLAALLAHLAARTLHWKDEGRPFVSEAYHAHAQMTLLCLRDGEGLDFGAIADRVEAHRPDEGRATRLLDDLWPDWLAGRRQRMRLTLQMAVERGEAGDATPDDLDRFLDFCGGTPEGRSRHVACEAYERHAFGEAPEASLGAGVHLQSLAVGAEHVMRALGRRENQLFGQFYGSWQGKPAGRVLHQYEKAKGAPKLATERGQDDADRARLLAEILALREQALAKGDAGRAEALACDMLAAARLRAAAHHPAPVVPPPRRDQAALAILRALLASFVRQRALAARRPDARPSP
jgi:hypothetical protein